MLLLLKGIIAGLVVIAVTIIAEKNAKIAGLVVLVPVVTMLSFISIGLSAHSDNLSKVALSTIMAMPVLLIYTFLTWQALERLSWPIALLVGLVGWFVAAFIYLKLIS